MALDPKKRQKQLLKKASKRKEKKLKIIPPKYNKTPDNVADLPIHECLVPKDLFEVGIGNIVFSRKMSSEEIVLSSFLIDTCYKGVAITYSGQFTKMHYESVTNKKHPTLMSVTPSYVRKLVEGAVEFARKSGVEPHKDYAKTSKIFGNIDASECKEDFEFGKDGKPYIVPERYDSNSSLTKTLSAVDICGKILEEDD